MTKAKKRQANVDPDHPDYHRRNIILPTVHQEIVERFGVDEDLAVWALDWHGGQGSMVYSLGSTGMSDYVSPSMIDAAVEELERDLPKVKDLEDRENLEALIAELDAVARFSSEFTTEEHGLGDVDSGYATWLMEKSKNPSVSQLKNKLLR